jgi:hypothetical protein
VLQKGLGLLRVFCLKIIYHLPAKLPRGSQAFDDFCSSIFEVYGFKDNDSYRHAIAALLQHFNATTTHRSKQWFVKCLINAEVRETAFFKIQEFNKKKELEKLEPAH